MVRKESKKMMATIFIKLFSQEKRSEKLLFSMTEKFLFVELAFFQ